jgi:diacylglycerol kinase
MKTKNLNESIKFSIEGIGFALKYERNIKIQFIISIFVIILGFILGLSQEEFLFIFLWIGMVISAEFFNTAIERALDTYYEDFSQNIKIIKDLCSAAVFVLAFFALISGILIFLPHIIAFLKTIFKGV